MLGTVAYHLPDPPPAGGHLRLAYYQPGGKRVSLKFFPEAPPPPGRGVLRLRLAPIDWPALNGERVAAVISGANTTLAEFDPPGPAQAP